MALEKVGLQYISQDVKAFLQNTRYATQEVFELNKELLKTNTTSLVQSKAMKSSVVSMQSATHAIKALSKAQMGLDGGLESISKTTSDMSSEMNDVANATEVLGSAFFGLGGIAAGMETHLHSNSQKIAIILDQYITLPQPIQNAITKLQAFINTMMRTNSVLGKALVLINKFVGFDKIFQVLNFNETAKDATTFSRALNDTGSSLNRLENVIRGLSLGLLVVSKRIDRGKEGVLALRKGLVGLAKSIDRVSDFFALWGKEVKTGDKELQSYNKEHGITNEQSEEGNRNWKEGAISLGKLTFAIANGSAAIKSMSEGKEPKGITGFLFDALKLRGLLKIWSKMPPQLQAISAAAGIAAVATLGAMVVLEKIGKRAAGLTAISDSYEALASNAGLATTFLDDFAASADNMITTADLLVLTNKALAGSTGKFQKELADSLPTLLEFARVRSAATGEDVNFLFESLIQGVKKAQPLILDNLGLVVDLTATYEKFAQSLNITADQLTENQKSQALLNSVNAEAVRNINILGEATLSNADKIVARGNIISDFLDKMSLSVQPLLSSMLGFQLGFLAMFQDVFTPLNEIFNRTFQLLAAIVDDVLLPMINPIMMVGMALLEFIISPFRAAAEVIYVLGLEVVAVFAPFAQLFRILEPLAGVLKLLSKAVTVLGNMLAGLISFFGSLVRMFVNATGIGKAFNSMIDGVNTTLQQAIVIVDVFADRLSVGLGFTFASLVNTVAKAARDILSIIADMAQGIADFLIGNSPPPKGPLSKIDTGGENTMNAYLQGLTGVSLKPVINMTRRVNTALGDIGSFGIEKVDARLKQLDLALRPFSENLKLAKERFEAIQGPADAALSAIDRQMEKLHKVLATGNEEAKLAIQSLDAQRASIHKNLDLQKDQVDMAQIQLAMKQSQQSRERTLLEIQKARIGNVKKEIKEEKKLVKTKVKKEKKKTGTAEAKVATGGIAAAIEEEPDFEGTTANESGDLMMAGFFGELNLDVFGEIGDEQARLATEAGRIGEGFSGLGARFTEPFEDIFGEDGTLAGLWDGFFGEEGFIGTLMDDLFGEDGTLKNTLDNFFGPESTFGLALSGAQILFDNFKTGIASSVDSIIAYFSGTSGIFGTLEWMFGLESGKLGEMLGYAQDVFNSFYDYVFGEEGVFGGLGAVLEGLINTPISTMMTGVTAIINGFIQMAEDFLNIIGDPLIRVINALPNWATSALQPFISEGRWDFPEVDFTVPQAKDGGVFSGGMLSVGERGQEFINPASKVGVFPNEFVRSVQSLESVIAQAFVTPVAGGRGGGGGVSNNSTQNQTININQPMSPSGLRQQMSLMR